MKENLEAKLVLAVLILLGAVGFFAYDCRDVFVGESVKTSDCYTLEFEEMNRTDSHTLALREGDVLTVDLAVDHGRADLFVGMDGEEPIYRANDAGTGAFELTVPKDGDYRITVHAKHAAGSIRLFAHGGEA